MRRNILLVILSASLLLFVGCASSNKTTSNESNNTSTTEKVEVTDKDSSNEEESEKETEVKKETNEKETNTNSTNNEKTETINLTIFIPNSNADGLDSKNVTINHLTAYSIINALADNNVVPSGTKAINFETKNGIGYLDVSSNIYNSNSGATGETLMLNSIRETFLKAFNIDKIKLTVNGSTYVGSHIDLGSDEFL